MTNRVIKVFGGEQRRPNIHIADMCECYIQSLRWPSEKIDGKIYNAGYQNHKLMEIAEMVRRVVGSDVQIVTTPTDDMRSYHISSEKIRRELGFEPKHTVEDAIRDLVEAFQAGKVPNSMNDQRYYNIKVLQGKKLEELQRPQPGNVIGKGPTFMQRGTKRQSTKL
jgi:dTDP-D-glucose 4,6-dehydratase